MLMLLVPVSLLAQVSVTATVDRQTVGVGQTFSYDITVTGGADVANPAVSLPDGFKVVSQGFSQQISMGNGGTSISKTYALVVAASAEGTFTLPAVKVEHGGKTYESQPVQIQVVPASQAPPPPQQQQQAAPSDPFEEFFGGGRQQQQQQASAFFKAYPEKTTCYVNEEVSVTYKMFINGPVQYGNLQQPSEITGFWAEPPAILQKGRRPIVEGNQAIGGVTFQVIPIFRQSYFPLSSGTKKIGPAAIQVGVASFFGVGNVQNRATEPVVLNVLPYPAGKPAGFSGNTGRYAMSASVDKRKCKQNEAISLKVTIAGTGNVKAIAKPAKPDFSSFKLYSSTSSASVNSEEGRVAGKKVFEYVLIPLQPGKLKISPFTYSFFDPVTAKYKTVRTEEITLSVEAVSEKELQNIAYPSSSEVESLGQDIRHIRNIGYARDVRLWHRSPFIWVILILQLLAILGLTGYYLYGFSSAGASKRSRASRAYGVLKKELDQLVKQGMGQGAEKIVSVLEKILFDYLAAKLGLTRSELETDNIMKYLEKKSVPKSGMDTLAGLLEEIQMFRYAPGGVSEKGRIEGMAEKVLAAVASIETPLGQERA